MKRISILLAIVMFILNLCSRRPGKEQSRTVPDTVAVEQGLPVDSIVAERIEIIKDFLYNQHTLADTYPYKDTVRIFQWNKIREHLTQLESIRKEKDVSWGILQNYKNLNGEAPLVKIFRRNQYHRVTDTFDVERYQAVPLFFPGDTTVAERYGRDGWLVRFIGDSMGFTRISVIGIDGNWLIPSRYLKLISDTVTFDKTVFVDRTNQNIITMAKMGNIWVVRSMNPATTGLHRPPFERETPAGMFVIQEKKTKMFYYKNGTTEIGGFAPYANRFCNGGYIHGVPVNEPDTDMVEFSPTLGTIPHSHMCVRNATSHAKFIYDWAPIEGTLVFVFD